MRKIRFRGGFGGRLMPYIYKRHLFLSEVSTVSSMILGLLVVFPPIASAEELWPTPESGWRIALTEKAGPNQERFGYIDAEPAGHASWRVRVECGTQSTKNGRIIRRVVGVGESNRGASPGFGGSFTLTDKRLGNFIVTQSARKPNDLRLPVEFVGVEECPRRGIGDLSTGD